MRTAAGGVLAAAVLGVAPGAAEPRLIWSDEFDGSGLDAAKWSAAHDCWGGGNSERQCYTPANVAVADGVLRLVARREPVSGPARPLRDGGDPAARRTRSISSGRIDTRGKASFRYGRIEIRAKLPAGQGLWPAIWMLPEHDNYGPYPGSGEIDIVEAVNLGVHCFLCRDQVHASRHQGPPSSPYRHETRATRLRDPDAFHVFALDWTPTRMTWSLDGRPYYRLPSRPPFDERFHLIVNLAVGGRWPESSGRKGVGADALPAEMVVDWVRVYAVEDGPG